MKLLDKNNYMEDDVNVFDAINNVTGILKKEAVDGTIEV